MPKITFLPMNKTVEAKVGENLLEVAHENGIELEGACEGSLACSTCHVILDDAQFYRIEPASDEEDDILDKAFGLTPTSRLGCQVKVDDSMDGMTVTIPKHTINIISGGH